VQQLNLVPFLLLIFDLIENVSVVILLLAYPTQMEGLARFAGIITSLKWILAGIAVALPLIGVSVWVYNHLAKSSSGKAD
jgi:hypothetical protein